MYVIISKYIKPSYFFVSRWGPRWQSGNTLASHLWGRGLVPSTASSGKAASCLPLVGSLQYRTLTNCMYWFPLSLSNTAQVRSRQVVGSQSQSWGLTSRSTARVILGQVLSIATCGTRTHRGDSLWLDAKGSWKGRRNQYIKLVKVLYCKLLAKGNPLSYLRSGRDSNSDLRGGRQVCYHCASVAPVIKMIPPWRR